MTYLDKFKNVPKWIYISLSIVIILALVLLSFKMNLNKFEDLSQTSLDFLDQAYKENIDLTKTSSSSILTEKQKEILLRKISIIEQNKLHHIDLIKKLSKNNYALLTLFPFLSAITAILVFLIIQKGWDSSNEYLKAYFILFTALTSLVGIYPEVYKQSDSIEKHNKNYINYKKIQKTIFNYSLTAPVLEKDSITFNQFINEINTQEKELINLIFSIEKKSLEKDIFSKINN